ncbi:hypothetical protein [Paenibacillus daejeonensis]|uniref:hypothetical protein n=1 Tax=Paenibacillus daejeonensis TaxID=135193 RepID=UPI0012FC223E|nr:hypothetical protein [Paenibacillus daejeonensis]
MRETQGSNPCVFLCSVRSFQGAGFGSVTAVVETHAAQTIIVGWVVRGNEGRRVRRLVEHTAEGGK